MLACSNGHQSTVKLLLDRKADINATNTYYRVFWAVLFFVPFGVLYTIGLSLYCCRSGWNAMFDAAMNGDESIVRLLLASKADIHQKAPRYFFSDFVHLPSLHHHCCFG
jgi:ankyrin repeat protein